MLSTWLRPASMHACSHIQGPLHPSGRLTMNQFSICYTLGKPSVLRPNTYSSNLLAVQANHTHAPTIYSSFTRMDFPTPALHSTSHMASVLQHVRSPHAKAHGLRDGRVTSTTAQQARLRVWSACPRNLCTVHQ